MVTRCAAKRKNSFQHSVAQVKSKLTLRLFGLAMTTHTHTHTQQNISHAVFLGSKSLGLNVLKKLYSHSPNMKWTIIHPNDADDPRSILKDFQNFARLCDLDILISASASATKQMLSDFKFDIGFVCGWYSILDAESLSYISNGLWGIHNSLLPKYRGGSPLVWSIINGDDFVGSSVFRLSEGMDTGDLLLQVEVENRITDDIQSLLDKIEERLLAELPQKWTSLVNGEAHLYPQSEQNATYCGQRMPEDGLINWDKNATDVHNFIRAQSPPYPCAYTFLFNEKILVTKSTPLNLVYDGTPGQILRRNEKSVLVACGNRTALEMIEILVDGTKQNPAKTIRSIKYRFMNEATLSIPI
jgi:methionyl-tRNA formyltransferase